MNNKGFIATSIMYSFFIVFALMCLTILGTYSHYRTLNVNLNNLIKSELINQMAEESSSGPELSLDVTNGSLSTNTLSLNNGGTQTLTITPNSGYYIKSGTCSDGFTVSGITGSPSSTSAQQVTITSSSDAGGTCSFVCAKPTYIIKNGSLMYSAGQTAQNGTDSSGMSHGRGDFTTLGTSGGAYVTVACYGSSVLTFTPAFNMANYKFLNVEVRAASNTCITLDTSTTQHWETQLVVGLLSPNKINVYNIASVTNSRYVAIDSWSGGTCEFVNMWLDEV